MINQVLFLLFVSLVGLLFMLLIRGRMKLTTLYFLSFPMGISLWSIMVLVIMTIGIPSTRPLILLLNLFGLLGLVIANYRKKNFTVEFIKYTAIFFGALSIAAVIFTVFDFSFFSNDSWRIWLGGRFIGQGIPFPPKLIALGGIESFIFHSSSYYFGFDYNHALYPFLTIFLITLFWSQIFFPEHEGRKKSRDTFYYVLFTLSFLFSSFFIAFNVFYIHSNLLSAIFIFIVLLGVWKRLITRDKSWLFVSALSLVVFALLRIESTLFSVIILIILLTFEEIGFKEKLYYFGFVTLMIVGWHVKLLLIIKNLSGLFNKYYLSADKIFLVIAVYGVLFVALLFTRKGLLSRLRPYLSLLMILSFSIIWTVTLFWKGMIVRTRYGLVIKRYGELILNVVKNGNWGVFWVGILTLFVLALVLKKYKHESVFVSFIISYLILFNPVHLFRGGWRFGWGDSANRMLVQIVFIISFYVFFKIRYTLFSKQNEDKK